MKIPIRSIKVGDRLRRDLGDISDLAASINRLGQIYPIVLDRDHNLIDGGRRITAIGENLGQHEIEAIFLDQLTEEQRTEIELEVQIRHKDFTWVEEVLGIEKLFNMRKSRDYGIAQYTGTGDNTGVVAEQLDLSRGGLHFNLECARAIHEYPDLANEQSKTSAFKKYKSRKEAALRELQASRKPEVATASRQQVEDSEGVTYIPKQPIRKAAWKGHGILYHADSRDVLKAYDDATVDCLITDPPFALGMFKEGQDASGARLAEHQGGAMYDDDPHKTMEMIDEVMLHASRVLKPDGHAYVFFHMTRYEPMYLMLRKHFGICEEVPIIWIKNTPGIGDPNRAWTYAYEPCFWVNRGRSLVKAQAFNYLKYDTIPPSQKIHPTEKPVMLLRHLVQASCVRGEVVLDPFAGSGSTLVAAHQLGCKFIGIEKHDILWRRTAERIAKDIGAEAPLPTQVTANAEP